jgi:uncharacterized protein with HEPN domain
LTRRSVQALLSDVVEATGDILRVTAEVDERTYAADRDLRRLCERNFQIAGEALREMQKSFHEELRHIDDAPHLIGFRHVVVHAYADLDPAIVWRIIREHLPELHEQASARLARLDEG